MCQSVLCTHFNVCVVCLKVCKVFPTYTTPKQGSFPTHTQYMCIDMCKVGEFKHTLYTSVNTHSEIDTHKICTQVFKHTFKHTLSNPLLHPHVVYVWGNDPHIL